MEQNTAIWAKPRVSCTRPDAATRKRSQAPLYTGLVAAMGHSGRLFIARGHQKQGRSARCRRGNARTSLAQHQRPARRHHAGFPPLGGGDQYRDPPPAESRQRRRVSTPKRENARRKTRTRGITDVGAVGPEASWMAKARRGLPGGVGLRAGSIGELPGRMSLAGCIGAAARGTSLAVDRWKDEGKIDAGRRSGISPSDIDAMPPM